MLGSSGVWLFDEHDASVMANIMVIRIIIDFLRYPITADFLYP
jgi:hypothetical protein